MAPDDARIDRVGTELRALRDLLDRLDRPLCGTLVEISSRIAAAIIAGGVVFTCGNGGSAADAQHIAGELVGYFRSKNRPGYRALALTTNSSIVTAIANDDSFDEIFSRQLASLGRPGDVLLALSTSGKSPNVLLAVETARAMGVETFAFLGKGGGAIAGVSDLAVVVPHDDFARIQEVHMTMGHILCGLVEEMVGGAGAQPA
ncbi:MAG: SIS domain-containing protein [Candidatus Krumholzibacteriota bacterium]|nr:SIS domain-containing protein [Candidatus Krumholzibacteriota bacterium]